ncbi:MAG TPA: ABC transporter substrate-binding protein [Kineosporiaceae bacterium]
MNLWQSHGARAAGAALAVTVLAACGSGSGSTGTTGSATGSAAPAASSPGSVPAGVLLKDGEITFCSDLTSPPLEFLDATQKPVGAEIELGAALAKSMGLTAKWANTAFNGIIPALQAKQCDAILSQLYIKPEREKAVDFVPYLNSSNTVMVKTGSQISGMDALCGKKVAAQTGTTAADYFKQASSKCSGGALDIRLFTKDSDALQQLKLGLVDAYGTTLETAAYVMKQQPGQFGMAGDPFGVIACGIATRKDARAVHDAVATALRAIRTDGSYDKILANWNLTGDALKS